MAYKVAGIDVHKKVLRVVVCEVGVPEGEPERRRFGTTTSQLRRLSVCLGERGVHRNPMKGLIFDTAERGISLWPFLRL